jgi:hypothetical protein
MRLSLVLAAIAYVGLFIAGQVNALPSADFCLTNPESPLCNPGEEPPVDPDPDPEPPTSFCEANPSLCPVDVEPVLDPAEEPVEEVEPLHFAGTFRVKGPGLLLPPREIAIDLSVNETTFSMAIGPCFVGTGSVVAKGGSKHELLFDAASLETFGEDMRRLVLLTTGHGTVLETTGKGVLKANADGSDSLRLLMRFEVEDFGLVAYKADLASTENSLVPPATRCLE